MTLIDLDDLRAEVETQKDQKRLKRKEAVDKWRSNLTDEERKGFNQRHIEYRKRNWSKIYQAQIDKKRQRKLRAIAYLGGKCVECDGIFHPAAFDFHHLNEDEKEDNISGILDAAWTTLKAEMDKCVLMCANCHRIHHATRAQGYNIQADDKELD